MTWNTANSASPTTAAVGTESLNMPEAILSCDGVLIVARVLNDDIHVSTLPSEHDSTFKTHTLPLMDKLRREFVGLVRCITLSHDASLLGLKDVSNTISRIAVLKLMLASNSRLLVLQLQLPVHACEVSVKVDILLDIEFPESHGNISVINFVFSDESVLVMFEIAPQAILLSLSQAQRNDVPNRKISSARGYALRHSHATNDASSALALLTRDRHSDVVVVLEHGIVVASFKADTVDAQGLKWSPDGTPVLAIWDSSAYGTKVKFVSALGHPLHMLDIGPLACIPARLQEDFFGTGVSAVDWVKKAGTRATTLFAMGNGSMQILFRSQDSKSMATRSCTFQHPSTLDNSKTTIWQHLGHDSYRPVVGRWDLGNISTGEVEIVAISSDSQKVASKMQGNSNIALIWQQDKADPIAAIIFQQDIRQLSWDSASSVLAITTADSSPSVHFWSIVDQAPRQIKLPRLKSFTSKRWQGRWIARHTDGHVAPSPLFVMSNKAHFDIVRLSDLESLSVDSVFVDSRSVSDESLLDLQSSIKSSTRGGDGSSIFF